LATRDWSFLKNKNLIPERKKLIPERKKLIPEIGRSWRHARPCPRVPALAFCCNEEDTFQEEDTFEEEDTFQEEDTFEKAWTSASILLKISSTWRS
jgi:hypothetical protein